jgi:hypothetical protein
MVDLIVNDTRLDAIARLATIKTRAIPTILTQSPYASYWFAVKASQLSNECCVVIASLY